MQVSVRTIGASSERDMAGEDAADRFPVALASVLARRVGVGELTRPA